MGERGRARRPRRRLVRFVAAVGVVGAVVIALPRMDRSLVTRAMDYGPDWRLRAEDPIVSRSDDRAGFDDSFLDEAEAAPGPTAQAGLGRSARVDLTPRSGSGHLSTIPASRTVPVRGQLIRYLIKVEDGLPYDRREFADTVSRVLNDKRSWGRGGQITFQQVTGGTVDLTVALASPVLTDKVCGQSGLDTEGRVSCFARKSNTAMLNGTRWATGVAAYGRDLRSYRIYLINHEVGHRLGHRHVGCPGAGKLAPVMVQQTKGVGACKPNPWPFP